MKLYIKQYGNTIHVGTRQDVGGCSSDPYKGSAYWSSGGWFDWGRHLGLLQGRVLGHQVGQPSLIPSR